MKKRVVSFLLALVVLFPCLSGFTLSVGAASADYLENISYYGDLSKCAMTAQQAAAFAEVIRSEEAKRKQDAANTANGKKYQLDNQVALFDTGGGIPAMIFVSSINTNQGFAYSFAYQSIWQWRGGKAVRYTLPTGWIWEGFNVKTNVNFQIYSDYLMACVSDIAMTGEVSSLAVFPFRDGAIASAPSTTALYRRQRNNTSNDWQEDYRIDGKAVSQSEVHAWEVQYGDGSNNGALAGYRYYRQGGYNIKGMTDADNTAAALDAYAIAESVAGFVDVPKNAFYADPVAWAVDRKITNGIDKTHFGPEVGCTRAQVVTFLWRAAGCPAPESKTTGFTDLKDGGFYIEAVAWAVENGITNGVSVNAFAPDRTCTRGQIVTFLWRYNGAPAPASTATGFTDVSEGAFYAAAVAWAVENGITKGTDAAHFSPDATCTRGQVVTFLCRSTESAQLN